MLSHGAMMSGSVKMELHYLRLSWTRPALPLAAVILPASAPTLVCQALSVLALMQCILSTGVLKPVLHYPNQPLPGSEQHNFRHMIRYQCVLQQYGT